LKLFSKWVKFMDLLLELEKFAHKLLRLPLLKERRRFFFSTHCGLDMKHESDG